MTAGPEMVKFIQAWEKAKLRLKRAEEKVVEQCEALRLANLKLGNLLCPTDAPPGKEFCIWVPYQKRSWLLTVEQRTPPDGTYKISWYQREEEEA